MGNVSVAPLLIASAHKIIYGYFVDVSQFDQYVNGKIPKPFLVTRINIPVQSKGGGKVLDGEIIVDPEILNALKFHGSTPRVCLWTKYKGDVILFLKTRPFGLTTPMGRHFPEVYFGELDMLRRTVFAKMIKLCIREGRYRLKDVFFYLFYPFHDRDLQKPPSFFLRYGEAERQLLLETEIAALEAILDRF